jgi:hypothetical protein
VWINMLEADSAQAAALSARRLDAQGLAAHFHDPRRFLGRSVAEALGGRGKAAWDIYLFYPPGIGWDAEAPAPAQWFHQLDDSTWADEPHHRSGPRLARALREAAGRFAAMEALS